MLVVTNRQSLWFSFKYVLCNAALLLWFHWQLLCFAYVPAWNWPAWILRGESHWSGTPELRTDATACGSPPLWWCRHSLCCSPEWTVLRSWICGQGIDICIKSCFVFGLRYPQPSRSSWTFIQKAVFGLNTQSDYTSSRFLQLLSSI